MPKRSKTLVSIAVDELVHDRDLRGDVPLDDLLATIPISGLEVPPLVRRRDDGKYSILDGNRRTKACRQLGIKRIDCLVFKAGDQANEAHLAELAAFHANTARKDLALSVMALELARYKAAYEALHPETAQGKARKGKKGRPGGELSSARPERYTKAAEKIIGLKERSVQRLVAIGERAAPEILRALDEKAITVKDAEAISRLEKTEQLARLNQLASEREARAVQHQPAGDGASATDEAESPAEDNMADLAVRHIEYAASLLAPLVPGPLDCEQHGALAGALKKLGDVVARFAGPGRTSEATPAQPTPAA